MFLLSELATGWNAGSGVHSVFGLLPTLEFIDEESLLSSGWNGRYTYAKAVNGK